MTFAIALLAVACGTETASTPSPAPSASASASASFSGLIFVITPVAGVAASGTIIVFPGTSSTTIEIKVTGLQANSSHVSHVHVGSCQQRGGIAFALNQVIADGQGVADTRTTLNQTYPPATGHWYIVVHAGPDMQGSNASYLLCGNLFS
jgi:hypothetical protein